MTSYAAPSRAEARSAADGERTSRSRVPAGSLAASLNASPRVAALGRQGAALQAKANRTGLPDGLKTGVEALAGVDMSDVQVHFNAPEPARLGARAYAQGHHIRLGPGQEQHLPHEAWHVAQQKQGRVKPTLQAKGLPINDDDGLEREADVMGARAVRFSGSGPSAPVPRPAPPLANPPVQRALFGVRDTGAIFRARAIYEGDLDRYAKGDEFIDVHGAEAVDVASPAFRDRRVFTFVGYGALANTLVLQEVEPEDPTHWVEAKDRAPRGAPVLFNLANGAYAPAGPRGLAVVDEPAAKKPLKEAGLGDAMMPTATPKSVSMETGGGDKSGGADAEDDAAGVDADDLAELNRIAFTFQAIPRTRANQGKTEERNLGKFVEGFLAGDKDPYLTDVIVATHVRLKEETAKSDPDPDVIAALRSALEVIAFRPRAGGYSGQHTGTLAVTFNEDAGQIDIEGRPAFEKHAIALPGMQKGFHRRHILAWHTIKRAIRNVSNDVLALDAKEGKAQLLAAWRRLAEAVEAREAELAKAARDDDEEPVVMDTADAVTTTTSAEPPLKKKGKKGKPPPDPTTFEGALTILLSKLNSNVLNLWPGEGYENSLINTYQYMFRGWATEVEALSKDEALAWPKKKADELDARIVARALKGKTGGTFKRVVGEFKALLASWKPEENATPAGKQLADFLLRSADTYEVDYPYSPDRKAFEGKHAVANAILQIAGILLSWSEKGSADTKGDRSVSGLVGNLEGALNLFMFPPDSKTSGADPASAKPSGALQAKTTPSFSLDFGLHASAAMDTSAKETAGKSGKAAEEPVFDRLLLEQRGVPQAGNTCYIAAVLQLIAANRSYVERFSDALRAPHLSAQDQHLLKATRAILAELARGRLQVDDVQRYRGTLIASGWLGGNQQQGGGQQDASELLEFLLRRTRWEDEHLGASVRHTSRLRGALADHAPETTASPVLTVKGLHAGGAARTLEQVFAANYDNTPQPAHDAAGVIDHRYRLAGTLPAILTLQVARFNYSTVLGRAFKLKEQLQAGGVLTIPHALSPEARGDVVYNLTSFVLHIGDSPAGGHYVTYSGGMGHWLLHDDAATYAVRDDAALAKLRDAYLVTYVRR